MMIRRAAAGNAACTISVDCGAPCLTRLGGLFAGKRRKRCRGRVG